MIIVESLIKSESSKSNEEKKYKYYYRLLKNEAEAYDNQNSDIVQCYGIEIERHDIVNNSIVNIERDCVKKISPHRYKVHNLLKFLYDNTVSPIHMIDVIGNNIDEHISEFEDPCSSKHTSTC